MNRILLIGVDGLDRYCLDHKSNDCPTLNKLMENAAKGTVEGRRMMPWDMVWRQALSGMETLRVKDEFLLTEMFPKMGVRINVIGEVSAIPAAHVDAGCAGERDRQLLLAGIPQYPADRADVTVIAVRGFFEAELSEDQKARYWKQIEAGLAALMADQRENTIVMLFHPFSHVKAAQGIRVNQWLCEQGFAVGDAHGQVDKNRSKAWFDAKSGGVYLNPTSERGVLEDVYAGIERLKVYARRGSDLRVTLFEDLYPGEQSNSCEPDIYVVPKNAKVYLEEKLAPKPEDGVMQNTEAEVVTSRGALFVSGYQVDTERQLENVSLLSIAPTMMDILTITPTWRMQEHSMKRQFARVETNVKEAAADMGGEAAVRSRLEALGY